MKANKRLITALLAVLTIFVLVPTMAFAATTIPAAKIAKWDTANKYKTVTDDNDHQFATSRVFSDGIVASTALADDSIAGKVYEAPYVKVASDGVAYFYDLDGSSFVYKSGSKWLPLDGAKMTQDFFQDGNNFGVKIVEQDYTDQYTVGKKKYDADSAEFIVLPFDKWAEVAKADNYAGTVSPKNWTISFESSDFDAKAKADQTVTLTVKKAEATKDIEGTPTAAEPDLIGTVGKEGTVSFTVKAEEKTPTTAEFYLDSTDSVWTTTNRPYDGAEHTVVCDDVPGYTVSYAVRNTAGKYDDVTAVTIKDVQKDAIQVKATFTNNKTKATVTRNFSVNLAPVTTTKIGFDNDASISDTDGVNWYSVEGSEYKAEDYVAITPDEKDPIAPSGDQRVKDTEQNAANKAAVEANKAEIMNWFAEAYEIKAVPKKSDANKIDLTIKAKNLSDKEAKALEDKYAALFLNMGKPPVALDRNTTATVFLNNTDVLAPEIEFVDSPTAMKFKAKKLKKKAASFTVTAISSNNEPVTYKLINAPAKIKIDKVTGQITLAKKLKKGTYKIKVKAYLAKAYQGMNGAPYYPSETHDIKIKVKK